jgi:hypothetical protein
MVNYIKGRKAHVFECAAQSCHSKSRFVCQYLDTGDATSTSNLRQHAKLCWGDEAVSAADDTQDAKSTHKALKECKKLDGSITSAFQRTAKSKIMYSHHQHTRIEVVHLVFWAQEFTAKKLTVLSSSIGSQRINGRSRLWTTTASAP